MLKAQFQIGLTLTVICSLILADEIGQLAHSKCAQYAKFEYDSSAFLSNDADGVAKCEELVMPLIIGGSKADRTEFPHMAAIGFGTYSKLAFLCGGSLISERFVMTAAHCQKDRTRGAARVVRLGSINLILNDDHTHIIAIDQIIVHPDYRPYHKYNDIALFRLARTIYFNEFIRPACLNVNHHIKWSTAIAIGFGLTATENVAGSNDLLKVKLNQISSGICRRTYKANRFMQHGIVESQFCAGDLAGHKDTCQGDSGGPIQVLVARPHCVYSIIGITSFGRFCGFENVPAVYTNVSHYIGWIEEHVWKK